MKLEVLRFSSGKDSTSGLLFDVTLRKIIDKTIPWRGKG